MAITNDIKSGLKYAADVAQEATQAVMDKARLRAKAAGLRQIIKNDTETRNQAYIELGKYFYENFPDNAKDVKPESCEIIEKTTYRINKASTKYFELLNEANNLSVANDNAEKFKKIINENDVKTEKPKSAKVHEVIIKPREEEVETPVAPIITEAPINTQEEVIEDTQPTEAPVISIDEESPDEFNF